MVPVPAATSVPLPSLSVFQPSNLLSAGAVSPAGAAAAVTLAPEA